MKVNSITLSCYTSTPSGAIGLYDETASLSISLTRDEAQELMALGLELFYRRQASIAAAIADIKPLQLSAPAPSNPDIAEGEYTTVEASAGTDSLDDTPF